MAVGDVHAFVSLVQAGVKRIELHGVIEEFTGLRPAVLVENAEAALPVMGRKLIERFVVERGDHFGDGFLDARTFDDRAPSVFLVGLQF